MLDKLGQWTVLRGQWPYVGNYYLYIKLGAKWDQKYSFEYEFESKYESLHPLGTNGIFTF